MGKKSLLVPIVFGATLSIIVYFNRITFKFPTFNSKTKDTAEDRIKKLEIQIETILKILNGSVQKGSEEEEKKDENGDKPALSGKNEENENLGISNAMEPETSISL